MHVVTEGSLEERSLEMRVTEDGRKFTKSDIPVFTKDPKPDGSFTHGMVPNRSCTENLNARGCAPCTPAEGAGAGAGKRGQGKTRLQ